MSLSVTTQADIEQSLEHIFANVIDGRDYSAIDRYFLPDYVDHSAMGDLSGTEAFSGMLEGFRAALPGFRHEISDVVRIADDRVVWQVHLTATFTGDFMGTVGTGQKVDVWVANSGRVAEDGRFAEHWGLGSDALARMLDQMGVHPPAAGS
jgi:predicted ester cyclase